VDSFFVSVRRCDRGSCSSIGDILSRITLVGALFLATIAVLPVIVTSLSGLSSLTIGGTALLIAVSVVIDLIKKVDSQVTMREY
jgi:preprotein translocase subunit SecY